MLVEYKETVEGFLSIMARQVRDAIAGAFNTLTDVASTSRSSKAARRNVTVMDILDLRVKVQSEVTKVFRRQMEDDKSRLSAVLKPST